VSSSCAYFERDDRTLRNHGYANVWHRYPALSVHPPTVRNMGRLLATMICVSKSIEIIDFTKDLPGGPVVKGLVVPEAAPATASDLANAINQIRPERQEIVVIAADHSVATRVTQITRMLAQSDRQMASVIDAMFVPGTIASPAMARQAQRNAEARQELIEEFGLRDSDQVAELAGSAASNRSATASRWLAARRIFAVNHLGAKLYPNFQFGTDGRPRPVIAGVLEAFEPYGLDGWEIALWFTTASGWLDDKRPVDLLTREPDQVVDTARHTFEEVDA
jgi:hypothetical protein